MLNLYRFEKESFGVVQRKRWRSQPGMDKSITNYLYWVPAFIPDANKEVMYAKWTSLISHVQNIHQGHGDLFPECLHEDLSTRPRKKKWLEPATKCIVKLEYILTTHQMQKDIRMLSTKQQTSELEGYHAVVNQFTPKMHGFYHGMNCRLRIAAMHYNENGRRPMARKKDGDPVHKIIYPRQNKGEYTVRHIKEAATYGYVQKLTETVIGTVESMSLKEAKKNVLSTSPPPLCSSFFKPNKEDAVRLLDSRFSHRS